MQTETLGTPCVTIATEVFAPLATREAEAFDMPDLPLVTVPHPIATLPDEQIEQMGEALVPAIVAMLTGKGQGA